MWWQSWRCTPHGHKKCLYNVSEDFQKHCLCLGHNMCVRHKCCARSKPSHSLGHGKHDHGHQAAKIWPRFAGASLQRGVLQSETYLHLCTNRLSLPTSSFSRSNQPAPCRPAGRLAGFGAELSACRMDGPRGILQSHWLFQTASFCMCGTKSPRPSSLTVQLSAWSTADEIFFGGERDWREKELHRKRTHPSSRRRVVFARCVLPGRFLTNQRAARMDSTNQDRGCQSGKVASRFPLICSWSKMEDDMDVSLATILEQRFNCLICWAPKLRMVYGKCQHRLCESCLFDETGKRRRGMDRCPVCSKADSFPKVKPNIPEDNIEAQRMLGVITCGYGCGTEMWRWELPEHIRWADDVLRKAWKGLKGFTYED